jgi:hypothetical protein
MTDRSVIVNEEEQANCRNGGEGLFHGHGGELALALLEGRRARRGLGRIVISLPIGAALADREYAASFCADPANAKSKASAAVAGTRAVSTNRKIPSPEVNPQAS